eukprot:TRINITY_DN1085_c0_g1_i6.p1 TRINITY_DN1085_c0_g1~~TRINITY_DN1085_c0_g1_i6.p1  ORF type:complete len:471 (+),score=80.04 TRINITY_DN1085_c0_g1_i6:46-1458(+)
MNFQRLPTDSLRAPFRLRKIEDYLFGVDQFMNPNEKLRTLDMSKGLVHVLISVVLSGIVSSITTLDSGMITANLEAGATFGMDLVWVTFWGTLASVVFSITSMKLGLATEEDLAEHCTEEFPWVVSRIMFLAMKIIVISIDMAQLVGMAVGMNLIFSLPLAWGLGLTFLDFLLVKHLYDSKVKYFEIFIGFSIFGAGFLFFASFATIGLPWTEFFAGLVPQLGASKLGLCLCVLATTLAPQNLFLQANIVTSRQHEHSERVVKDIMFSTSLELVCSRFFTWLSMLIIMTLSFQELYSNSETNTSTLEEGASMLRVLFTRPTASVIFGVLLVCTGIVGSTQATLSDHSATEKFLNTKIKPFKIHAYIRYISFIPTLMVAIYGGDAALYDQILYCLVLVSISTPLVLVSLTKFTSDEAKMGSFVNYTVVSFDNQGKPMSMDESSFHHSFSASISERKGMTFKILTTHKNIKI